MIRDLLRGGGEALDRFVDRSSQPVAGANLCQSSCDSEALSSAEMERLIGLLSGAAGQTVLNG